MFGLLPGAPGGPAAWGDTEPPASQATAVEATAIASTEIRNKRARCGMLAR
ncbi:hypothetical protein GCM10027360_74350 [Amycolatopsis echigonensis]